MESVQDNINDLINLFNTFKASYDEEKLKLFEVSKALCDNTKMQDEKIKLMEDSINKFNDTIEGKINNIRLSILKINQTLDSTINKCNENNNILLERIENLEKLKEVDLFEELNNKIVDIDKRLKALNSKNLEKMLDKFKNDINDKITTLEASYKHSRSVADLICIVYNKCKNFILAPYIKHKNKKLKEQQEAELLRKKQEAELEAENRRIKEAEERKLLEAEREKQQIAQIQSILGKSKRQKNGSR